MDLVVSCDKVDRVYKIFLLSPFNFIKIKNIYINLRIIIREKITKIYIHTWSEVVGFLYKK